MPFLTLFLLSWTAFFLWADRARWRQFLPACMLAMLMSFSSDVIVADYPLWAYHDTIWDWQRVPIVLFDDLGIYPVATYLFLQYYPAQERLRTRILYFAVWTSGVILLEFTFCRMGWMVHQLWWRLLYSYLADWTIFYILLRFSKSYRLVVLPSKGLYQLPDDLHVQMHGAAYLVELQGNGTHPLHSHSTDELNIVVKGQLLIEYGNEQRLLSAGERFLMPARCLHRAHNPAPDPALVIAIFSDSVRDQQQLRSTI